MNVAQLIEQQRTRRDEMLDECLKRIEQLPPGVRCGAAEFVRALLAADLKRFTDEVMLLMGDAPRRITDKLH